MGLFGKLKENMEKAKEHERMVAERRKTEFERDSKRPAIADLPFTTLENTPSQKKTPQRYSLRGPLQVMPRSF